MTHILARVALAGAIAFALAQTSPTQVLLKNTSFEDSPFFIAPWELVNPGNLSNPRVTAHPYYGNYFAASLRSGLQGGIRQAFSVGGTEPVSCAFSASWRTLYSAPYYSPTLHLEVFKRSDNSRVLGNSFTIASDQSLLWQPIGYWFRLSPGDYWASVSVQNTQEVAFDLDDLMLRQAGLPIISPKGRNGGWGWFAVASSDERVWHVLFVAMQRLDPPLAIPGIRGALELDPVRDGGLLILGVKLGSSTWQLPSQPIASLRRTVFFQALDFNPILNVMQFGSRTGVLYYW